MDEHYYSSQALKLGSLHREWTASQTGRGSTTGTSQALHGGGESKPKVITSHLWKGKKHLEKEVASKTDKNTHGYAPAFTQHTTLLNLHNKVISLRNTGQGESSWLLESSSAIHPLHNLLMCFLLLVFYYVVLIWASCVYFQPSCCKTKHNKLFTSPKLRQLLCSSLASSKQTEDIRILHLLLSSYLHGKAPRWKQTWLASFSSVKFQLQNQSYVLFPPRFCMDVWPTRRSMFAGKVTSYSNWSGQWYLTDWVQENYNAHIKPWGICHLGDRVS